MKARTTEPKSIWSLVFNNPHYCLMLTALGTKNKAIKTRSAQDVEHLNHKIPENPSNG